MKETNPLAIIDKVVTENNLARRIGKLRYPFLHTLSRLGSSRWEDEIRQINILAHEIFAPGESLGPIDDLVKWQKASPKSWLVCRMNNEIVGYVHVEPLSSIRGDAIREGVSHEGEIQSRDILRPKELRNSDYIHIGSIVGKSSLDQKVQPKVAIQLLAGIVNRILDLTPPGKDGAYHILAVDYPDAKGKHHARRLFACYGFEHQAKWRTAEDPPNDVYILDLNKSPNPASRKLLDAVIVRRGKHRLESSKRRKKILRVLAVTLAVIAVVILLVTEGWLQTTIVGALALVSAIISLFRYADDEIAQLRKRL